MGDLRKEWQAQRMRIEEWWPKLDPETREWLIANNGDVVPTTVLGQIAEAGVIGKQRNHQHAYSRCMEGWRF